MSHAVFISHSSRDKPIADGVCAALEAAGIRCWIAPRDLVAGRPFPGEIIRGIKSCRVMVLLFSSAANASPEVLREVQLATTHRLHLVNFRIEQSGVSDDLAYFLGVPHWLDALTQPMREHHTRLIESVQALLAMDRPEAASGERAAAAAQALDAARAASPGAAAEPTSVQPPSRRRPWVAPLTTPFAVLAFVVVIGLAIAGPFLWRRMSAQSSSMASPASSPDSLVEPRQPAHPTPGEGKPNSQPTDAQPNGWMASTAPSAPPSTRGTIITGPVTLLSPTETPRPEPEPEIEPAVEPPPEMKAASATQPWENSLGMKFVRVPIAGGPTDGQLVLASIYETRQQDYAAFWAENPKVNAQWKMLESEGPDQPVTMVSWSDARAFCAWLSQRERASGKLPAGLRYRLPSDHEWSCLVGLTEDASLPPLQKDKLDRVQFPWGKIWPPPIRAGNYPPIPGRPHDEFMIQAPVGSFDPNPLGIYDLGGNVAEWCEDADAPGSVYHLQRGGSFFTRLRDDQLSSARAKSSDSMRPADGGFRIVLSGAVKRK